MNWNLRETIQSTDREIKKRKAAKPVKFKKFKYPKILIIAK